MAEDEKRMINDYEVKYAVQLAGSEIIFAENAAAEMPYLVCDCSWDNPFGVDEYKNAIAGDDPVELLREFTTRLSADMDSIEEEREERDIPFETLKRVDCRPDSMNVDLEGSVIVIKPEKLSPVYRTVDHQLALCTGGNGSRPNARGRAVFCTNLYTGKSSRWERQDIAGIILPERMPEWAREKLTALQKPAEREHYAGQKQSDTLSIYQLKHDDSTWDFRFEPFDRLKAAGLIVDRANYECVYTAPMTAETDSLDKIFKQFNINHPQDFAGHSLSVSDIVAINRDGQQTAHYVDSIGFKEIPGFFQSAPQKNAEKESVIEKIRQGKQTTEPQKPSQKKHDKGGPEL